MQKKFPEQLKKPRIIRRELYEDREWIRSKWWIYNRKRPIDEIDRICLSRRYETIKAQSKEIEQAKKEGRRPKTKLVKLPGGTYARIPDDY